MSPPHDAVDGFFISYILNDITGMLERKFYFIPFHGEDAAVSFGQCMNRTGKMGGICCDSQIVNHVAGRYDSQSRVEKHGSVEDGFIIGFVVFFMAMAHVDKVFAEFPFFNELLQLLHIELIL